MKKLTIQISGDRQQAEYLATYLNLALRRGGIVPVVTDKKDNALVMKLAMDDFTVGKSLLEATTSADDKEPKYQVELVISPAVSE